MRDLKVIGFVSLTIFLLCNCFAQEQWYNLMDNQNYLDDFELASGQSRDIIINSEIPLWVGFTSDATIEQYEEYGESNPVKLHQPGMHNYVKTLMGGSMLFSPVEGKIKCKIENNSPDNLKFVIYTKEDEEK